MKNNRVNIDRDVQSRQRIAATSPAPKREEEKHAIPEPPKDEPQEEQVQEETPKEADSPGAEPRPEPKAKKGGRAPQGDL